MSAGLIGLAFALGNVGWLLGALVSSRLQSRFGVGPISIAAMALTPVSLLLTAIAPASFPLPFLVAAGILGGIGAVVYNIAQVSLRQAITPERMQGRMNSVMRFIVWGTIPLGALIGGALGSTVGLRETLFIGAAGSVLALVPLLLSPIRSVREIPTQVEDVEPTIAAGEGGARRCRRRRCRHGRRDDGAGPAAAREGRRLLWPRGVFGGTATSWKLWSAETISQFGTQGHGLALPFVAIVVLDASAFAVAALDASSSRRSCSSRCPPACGSTVCPVGRS